jgi:carbamoyltransferase
LTFADVIDAIYQVWQETGTPWHRFVRGNRAAIAATAQNLIEEYMIGALRGLHRRLGHQTLCAAGGLFLNCKMNHEIMRRTPFENLFVFPAAGDDGQAIGAAFFANLVEGGLGTPLLLNNAYLGPSHGLAEIADRIDHFGLYAKYYDQPWLVERLADDLAEGKTIGLLRGRSEIGPRALGHRSILADPRRSAMQDQLNKIKGRELFRPFAPMTTSEDQFTYFDLEQASPYMLLATTLKEQYWQSLPAIVHADGTSRVQSVSVETEPFIHALLRAFEARTGFPIILNTSFNLAGEPIVQSPHDAISTYLRSNIDTLVLEDAYITSKVTRRLG